MKGGYEIISWMFEFTIQNVPIKCLYYILKIFVDNLFTIQNVPIKLL